MTRTLVTGGAGFIGSYFIRELLATPDQQVLCIDKLTYAARRDALPPDPRGEAESSTPPSAPPCPFRFVQGDINDVALLAECLADWQPTHIVHFAAESHVDRSIDSPLEFVQTNVMGTCQLLRACHEYWQQMPAEQRSLFRLVHVSTDEVYGSLGPTGQFHEHTAYDPRSPYSASKAASDHFVRAWHHTYGLPTLITNCSNNYGPFQSYDKLIPLMISRVLHNQPLPVYGDGMNVRDWLHVSDHCAALRQVLAKGEIGESYNIGGDFELTNLQVIQAICEAISELRPELAKPWRERIEFVTDRPGHDRRYAVSFEKLQQLGWNPRVSFQQGIRDTVAWYLEDIAAAESIDARGRKDDEATNA